MPLDFQRSSTRRATRARLGGRLPPGWSYWPITLVGVHSDDGAIGIGSVYSDVRLVRAALEVLEPLYRDELVIEPERVTEKLRRHAAWIGRGGTIDHAISGIDIALWDLFGQVTKQPVGRLLGGRYRDRVRPYASIVIGDVETLADRLAPLRAEGFRAFKIGWIPFGRVSSTLDELIVRTAREAVGEESDLMVDAGGNDAFWQQGYKWALRTADMVADYGVTWLEEPLNPNALDDFVRLRERSRTPIAAGESLVGRQAFKPWIERHALDIVQPDVSKAGGITEQRRIAQLVEDNGLQYVGHGSFTAIGVAADLQLASAFPTASFVEYETDSAYMNQICNGAFQLDADGMFAIPDAPGLGVTLDREALRDLTQDEL